MTVTESRLYLVSFELVAKPQLDYSRLFDKLSDLKATQIVDKAKSSTNLWLLTSSKRAVDLYFELEAFITVDTDHLLVAEITENTFGSFVMQRQRQVIQLIGNARLG